MQVVVRIGFEDAKLNDGWRVDWATVGGRWFTSISILAHVYSASGAYISDPHHTLSPGEAAASRASGI